MKDEAQESLTAVAKALARAASAGWTRAELRITAAGGMTETEVDVQLADGSVDTSAGLDREGRVAAYELRERMYEVGKGSWYNARVVLVPSGEVSVEFDYERPPFDGDADAELLIADQESWPRDAELLPVWHPSRG
ncbi:hypothetical protein FB561_0792 [Kribbella amoyensis]|uniref:DUF600 family protein n=1 Tax=Kribbella amoyensis TaxID=996641 RepID=A0A561BLM9_9ACTN|nr:hypothetical protein [Kribbella amoyensis]TWD79727.1 hypothetical protein FB561_0792 [Kribbella amoyensis]